MASRFTITKIAGREILDSRGNPTVEATVYSEEVKETAAVPSGASTGKREALELRDGDAKRYAGLGVLKAVKNIDEILRPKLVGLDCREQTKLDRIMIDLDGTSNKSRLGANAILAVSLAVARLASRLEAMPLYDYLSHGDGRTLPVPVMNVINGGKHAGTGLKVQEFMVIPAAVKSFAESLRVGTEVYHKLKSVIESKLGKQATNVGDEGGFAPPLNKTSEALEMLTDAVDWNQGRPFDDSLEVSRKAAQTKNMVMSAYAARFTYLNAATTLSHEDPSHQPRETSMMFQGTQPSKV